MSEVSLRHITKTYRGGTRAVSDFNLEVVDEEFLVFVGPSGCGKSTLLRLIAGLENADEGDIYIDGVRVNDMAPDERDIAMVFQNYALYPHMSVYENMAFALRLQSVESAEIDRLVRETADLLEISDVLERKPKDLSGGQRQRVAMGRAIVRSPRVFLMDEPLSNLDPQLRGQLRSLISRLHAQLGTTFIYVTHDQIEAMTLASRIVVMKEGVIQQVGAPQEVYDNPANTFVARFIGSPAMNIIEADVVEGALVIEGIRCELPAVLSKRDDGKVLVGVRPERVDARVADGLQVSGDGDGGARDVVKLDGHVDVCEPMGAHTLVHCRCGEKDIQAFVRVGSIESGQAVRVTFNVSDMHFFDYKTGEAL
ncbi:MAG: sn-glycerol-3-phosphate ABC transporter ATP-binding protein UgpC [Actinomycetaceae bacterium]|nr:sn-glycerol-3-phosphate ABC transporter ATP-binding protein UgpC [Actinomycetaceae bacterium]